MTGARGGNPHRRTELDEGLAQRRQREDDADGEHRAGPGQDRPEQAVPPVPLLRPAAIAPAAGGIAAASPGVPAAGQPGQETSRCGRAPAGVGRPGSHPRADPLQPVRMGLDLIRGSMQRPAQVFPEFHRIGSLRRHAVESRSGHYSCSRAARRADMPREVWLLTAPRLIPMAAAMSASDRSA